MLKRAFLAFAALAVGAAAGAVLHAALAKGDTVFSSKRPAYLGVTDGRLARCKRTPNCVSSQADPADAEHFIAPIAFRGGSVEAMEAVRAALGQMERCTVLRHEENYLYAEFRSKLMGYVDDVEFVHDPVAGVIHVRSASRLGRRDFGVNRKRVEAVRARIERRAVA
ncbi:MAG: DUF1499 domain-containing protein [Burkholderiales bacterium]